MPDPPPEVDFAEFLDAELLEDEPGATGVAPSASSTAAASIPPPGSTTAAPSAGVLPSAVEAGAFGATIWTDEGVETTTLQLPPRAQTPGREEGGAGRRAPRVEAPRATALGPAHALFDAAGLVDEARRRAEASVKTGDRLALARARMEHALLLELLKRDTAAAEAEFRAAHAIAPSLRAPIAAVRRLVPYGKAASSLALVEAELRTTVSPANRAVRLLEWGRLLLAAGAAPDKAVQAFTDVLAESPDQPAALRGLETALSSRPRALEQPAVLDALASHLALMASAFRDDRVLSAWLEVERAALLEKLKRPEAARAALEGALQLDPRIGPTRDAYVRHLVVHQNIDLLVDAWTAEAILEGDSARAGRLFYVAARLASERLEQPARAIELHRRATALSATSLFTRKRALHELLRLYRARNDAGRGLEVELQLLAWASPSEKPHWHRRIAAALETMDRSDEAAEHAALALQSWPDDDESRERLDRVLGVRRRHEERLSLWLTEATRLAQTGERVAALMRAARIAEHDLDRPESAVGTLRSAFALDPDNLTISNELTRLLVERARETPSDGDAPSADARRERTRARIDLLTELAASSSDPERRMAHLEKLAALHEDEIGEPERALAIYQELVAESPKRRSAWIGLGRTAARTGDARAEYRALVTEAEQIGRAALARALLLRASDLASRVLGDADSALDLVKQLLARNAGDQAAHRAAADIHTRIGRHGEAIAELRVLLQHAQRGPRAFGLALEIARLLDERMRRPGEALSAYRDAFRLDPTHPLPVSEMRRLLLASEDHVGLARELVALAAGLERDASELAARERGRLLFEAAEVFGDRLDEPDQQRELLMQALRCCPDEADIRDALERVYLRQSRFGELAQLLEQKPAPTVRDELTLASLLADGRDPVRAAAMLRRLESLGEAEVAIVRTMERACAQREQWAELGAVLRREIAVFSSEAAQLGAMNELFFLETYRGVACPEGARSAVELLTQAAPSDVLVHEAVLRRGLVGADAPDAAQVAQSLAVLASDSDDALHAAVLHLAAAIVLESSSDEVPVRREAARRYRLALAAWPDCLTAARGLHRQGVRLGDQAAIVAGARALGGLESDPATRAERLADAAEALGPGAQRAEVVELYVRALHEHADCSRAADGLIALAPNSPDPGLIADALRRAIERTNRAEQAVKLGRALASLAQKQLADPTVVLEALRRVRKKAPGHVGNLLALADACAALGLWPETAEIAEGALGITRDPNERLAAAVVIADAHAHLPDASADAAHRARQAEDLAPAATGDAQTSSLARLSDVYRALGEHEASLRVLARALACSGANPAMLAEVTALLPPNVSETAEDCARVLEQAISLAQELGLPVQPAWLTALGTLEAAHLGRVPQGIAHLREAVALDLGEVATYEALVRLLSALGSADDAARELLGRIPTLLSAGMPGERVAAVLELSARTCTAASRAAQARQLAHLAAYLRGNLKSPSPALPEGLPRPASLTGAALTGLVSRDEAYAWLQVTTLIGDVLPKLLRAEAAALGVLPRDRIGRGEVHPLRVLADRVSRAFGELSFDLYVDAGTVAAPRLVPSDPPALVLPRGYGDLPLNEQAAGIARLLVYVALRVPWIEELGASDLLGVLVGALRVAREAAPRTARPASDETSIESWRARLGKALSRKQKRALEELGLDEERLADPERFRAAIRSAALIGAYLITFDLVSTLNHLRRIERELAPASAPLGAHPLLQHAPARRLIEAALQETPRVG